MEQAVYDVYKDISARTGGEVYIGVVGPVRTGKSTFIKRFMELFVIPNMEEPDKTQARDELPQSAAGKTIMTTEPKFIPKEGALIKTEDGVEARIRLIDCVGYMVDGALGHEENDMPRMVKTPWFEEEIPFVKAAEVGTKKVIHDHSNIGIVMTGDGSFGEISVSQFEPALDKTVLELKGIGKPFIILLNSSDPSGAVAKKLSGDMQLKYGVSVIRINAAELSQSDISRILTAALSEFPVSRIDFHIPKWVELLNNDHPVKKEMILTAKRTLDNVNKMKELEGICPDPESRSISEIKVSERRASDGTVSVECLFCDECYYKTISDYCGFEISSELQLYKTLFDISGKYLRYKQVEQAMERVKGTGYSVVTPVRTEILLSEPELIKQSGKYGVKMRASAPSIHLIKTNIETEIEPIVGSEDQANDLINYIKAASNEGEEAVWTTNIFGKTISQIVEDGMNSKISQLTDECQQKLQDALAKIINDSNGGIVCIII